MVGIGWLSLASLVDVSASHAMLWAAAPVGAAALFGLGFLHGGPLRGAR